MGRAKDSGHHLVEMSLHPFISRCPLGKQSPAHSQRQQSQNASLSGPGGRDALLAPGKMWLCSPSQPDSGPCRRAGHLSSTVVMGRGWEQEIVLFGEGVIWGDCTAHTRWGMQHRNPGRSSLWNLRLQWGQTGGKPSSIYRTPHFRPSPGSPGLWEERRNQAERGVCRGWFAFFSRWQQLALHLRACGCDTDQNVYHVPLLIIQKPRQPPTHEKRAWVPLPAPSPLTLPGWPHCRDRLCPPPDRVVTCSSQLALETRMGFPPLPGVSLPIIYRI